MKNQVDYTPSAASAPGAALRWWLIAVTLAAALSVGLSLIFGWLINLDTQIEVSQTADSLVQANAAGFRAFAWIGIATFVVLMTSGVAGAWMAFRRGRSRLSFGISWLAAGPMLALVILFAFAGLAR